MLFFSMLKKSTEVLVCGPLSFRTAVAILFLARCAPMLTCSLLIGVQLILAQAKYVSNHAPVWWWLDGILQNEKDASLNLSGEWHGRDCSTRSFSRLCLLTRWKSQNNFNAMFPAAGTSFQASGISGSTSFASFSNDSCQPR